MDNQAVTEIEKLALRANQVTSLQPDAAPFLIRPDNSTVIDVEKQLARPVRKRGDMAVYDASSLTAYIDAHAQNGTIIIADEQRMTLKGVINHHDAVHAGWGDHTVTLTCRESDEWKAWMSQNGEMLSQAAFAHFIEDNLIEVVEPSQATMLEISRTIDVKKKADFSSSIRTNNGQVQFHYDETISGTTQGGKLAIPEEFVLGIKPFIGSDKPYKVTARLRYSMRQGDLKLGYVINRHKEILRAAFAAIVNDVAAADGIKDAVPILNGSAQ